eukprot:57967_1
MDHTSFLKENDALKEHNLKQELRSIGIPLAAATKCIEVVHTKHSDKIHVRTESEALVVWIVDELLKENTSINDFECDAVILKAAFRRLYSKDLIDVFADTILK